MPRKPKTEIDAATVEHLARLGCSASEIADYFGVSEPTIRRRFARKIARARAARRIKLRKFQWDVAEQGSVPMLVFLGKHELGQGDEKPAAEEKVIRRRAVRRE